MYFPFCWKTCIYKVNIFSKFVTSENANLKNYVLGILYAIFPNVLSGDILNLLALKSLKLVEQKDGTAKDHHLGHLLGARQRSNKYLSPEECL